MKWVLFVTAILTVPSPYFLLVVGCVVPTIAILFSMLKEPFTLVFGALHLLVYIPLYYFLATLVVRLICGIPSKFTRMCLLLLIIAGLMYFPLSKSYSFSEHGGGDDHKIGWFDTFQI